MDIAGKFYVLDHDNLWWSGNGWTADFEEAKPFPNAREARRAGIEHADGPTTFTVLAEYA